MTDKIAQELLETLKRLVAAAGSDNANDWFNALVVANHVIEKAEVVTNE